MTTALPGLVSDKQKFPTQWCHVWRQSIYYLGKKKTTTQRKPNKTSVALCQETCCTCLYTLADKDQMRQAMKWLTKSESYLRHPKAHLVNLRKLLTENWGEKSKGLSGKKQMTLSTSSLLSHSEKQVLVRSRAQQKNRNLSDGVKKAWIEPQLSWKLDLLIASLFHCQNRHLTEEKYLSNIAIGQTFPHW